MVEQIDGGKVVDVIYLDFRKAFDVINHSVLLGKLRAIGFSYQMLGWIESFLVSRSMCVSVGGSDSSVFSVGSGVPQGSVLGPLLFLIYVNCLGHHLSCRWYAFADDFKLYISHERNTRVLENSSLQVDLNKLVQVAESWNLKLNVSKCVVMRFGEKVVGNGAGSGYFLGLTELLLVHSHRDLGVLVDPSLRFHGHVDSLVRKASGLANNLLRSTICRTRGFMVTVFMSHIRPLMDYCSTVWNVGFLGDCRKLESVQRKWTKNVAGLENMNYQGRLRALQLFSIRGRMVRCDLIKLWKIFHSNLEVGLLDIVERQSHQSTRGHAFKLSVPRCRKDIKRRFFSARSVLLWNGLSGEVVQSESLEVFKRKLDNQLADLFYATADD